MEAERGGLPSYELQVEQLDPNAVNDKNCSGNANDASTSWWTSSSSEKNKVKLRSKLLEPRFCFQTRSDVDVLDDGYGWRKYGQKATKDSLQPRFKVHRVKRRMTLVVLPNGAKVTGLPVIMPESQNQCGNEFNASPPCDAIFKYLISTLVAVLALKYNGKTENPFETHPPNMWTFVIAICIYCLVLGFMKEMKITSEFYSRILSYVTIISGAVSCVSLVSIFLPDLLGRLVLRAFLPIILLGILFKRVIVYCIGQSIVNAIDWMRGKFNNSLQKIANLINWARDKFHSARRDLMEQQPSLPITSF